MKNNIAYSYIRFSTKKQTHGSSLERQLSQTREYAKNNDLRLDESLSFQDLGVSSYRGTNAKEGQLANLLKAVESGKIPSGSTIIIESIDRLSRNTVSEAMSLLLNIINSNIRIVTLINNAVIDKTGIDNAPDKLMFSLIEMIRANNESRHKSERKKASVDLKLKLARRNKTPISAKCPAWLELDKTHNKFVLINNRVALIKRIFEDYLNGNGVYTIVKNLNEGEIKVWGRGKAWHLSYVKKILNNRAVIGEYQPFLIEDGKRVVNGDPIENYFPAIIDMDTFNAVQLRLKNNVIKGGKTGKVSNLFTGLARCGYCGQNMVYQNKGNGLQYLICSASQYSKDCERISFNYSDFEKSFLEYCNEIDVSDILSDENNFKSELNNLYKENASAKQEQIEADKKLKKAFEELVLLNNESLKDRLRDQVSSYDDDYNNATDKVNDSSAKIKELEDKISNVENKLKSVKTIYSGLNKLTGNERIEKRRQLRTSIQRLIEKIDVFAGGRKSDNKKIKAELLNAGYSAEQVQEYIKDYNGFPNKERAYFIIQYQNGRRKLIQNRYDKNGTILRYDDNFDINSTEPFSINRISDLSDIG